MEVTNLTGTEQEIHASVKVKSSNLYWLFTAVYASPRFRERRLPWNNLKYVSSIHNLPWIIASDFNELLSSEEMFGGRLVSLYRANLFKECLDSCNMADLGFQGPRFTWTNKQDITTLIQGRLDRFFANPDWCVMYPEAQITHLTRCSSDHCLVLLELHLRATSGFQGPSGSKAFGCQTKHSQLLFEMHGLEMKIYLRLPPNSPEMLLIGTIHILAIFLQKRGELWPG